jgi:ribonuclease M5
MYSVGLSGGPDSAALRNELLKKLGLPEHLPVNGLLDVLNALYTKDEFFAMTR